MFKESAVITSNKGKEDGSLKTSDVSSKFGVLLMGVDNDEEREQTDHLDSARTDSLIYMVYDGENKKSIWSASRGIFGRISMMELERVRSIPQQNQ